MEKKSFEIENSKILPYLFSPDKKLKVLIQSKTGICFENRGNILFISSNYKGAREIIRLITQRIEETQNLTMSDIEEICDIACPNVKLDAKDDNVVTGESVLIDKQELVSNCYDSSSKQKLTNSNINDLPSSNTDILDQNKATKEQSPNSTDLKKNLSKNDNFSEGRIKIYVNNKVYVARNPKQEKFLSYLSNEDFNLTKNHYQIIFALGAAGTGKTFLSVLYGYYAISHLEYQKLIITRPAVEAGEKLGFLPGDISEKVHPYLIPLLDNLYAIAGKSKIEQMIRKNLIEIAPLAYMRGRSLDNSFVILDEGQNATATQIKMFLTRLGNNSKLVLTGDPSQTDLQSHDKNSLSFAANILKNLEQIATVNFTKDDIVRNSLIAKILSRYEDQKKY